MVANNKRIEETPDLLPEVYAVELYRQRCDVVYRHVYDSHYGRGRLICARAG